MYVLKTDEFDLSFRIGVIETIDLSSDRFGLDFMGDKEKQFICRAVHPGPFARRLWLGQKHHVTQSNFMAEFQAGSREDRAALIYLFLVGAGQWMHGEIVAERVKVEALQKRDNFSPDERFFHNSTFSRFETRIADLVAGKRRIRKLIQWIDSSGMSNAQKYLRGELEGRNLTEWYDEVAIGEEIQEWNIRRRVRSFCSGLVE